ncbi:MAG: alpha/beta hydrolase [Acidisphaera sp.]|nr:alpha/beta hydrolase [Acidisphaera sp.]
MPTRTFVLLHGAWHGGWCFRPVAARLRAAGHLVFTPTQTGLGERRHLLSRDLTIETFIRDLTGVIESEELSDIILVGHSFGGIAVSGAADRMPERIRHLVYLDSLILEDGASPMDRYPPGVAEERRRIARETSDGLSAPVPDPKEFGVPPGPVADWLRRRMTPHPMSVFESRLRLKNPVGNGLPRTYVACTAPAQARLAPSWAWVHGRPGWTWRELAACHDAIATDPDALTDLLLDCAR